VERAGLFLASSFDDMVEEFSIEALAAHYMSMFEEVTPSCPALMTAAPKNLGKITGETNAAYFRQWGAAARMHQLLPSAKLLFLLNDPIDDMFDRFVEHSEAEFKKRSADGEQDVRGLSSEMFVRCFDAQMAWLQMCSLDNWVSLPRIRWDHQGLQCYKEASSVAKYGECESDEDPLCLPAELERACPRSMVLRSVYGVLMQQYLRVYPLEAVKVVTFEDFVRDPTAVVQEVTEFLKIGDLELTEDMRSAVLEYKQQYSERPTLLRTSRLQLKERVSPLIRSLESILKIHRGMLW